MAERESDAPEGISTSLPQGTIPGVLQRAGHSGVLTKPGSGDLLHDDARLPQPALIGPEALHRLPQAVLLVRVGRGQDLGGGVSS